MSKPLNFIHPDAVVETSDIGKNTRIWAFTHVMAKAKIGEFCNIGENCFIENGVVIGDYVTIKNGISVWQGIIIKDGVFIGPEVAFTNDLLPRSFIKNNIKDYLISTVIETGVTIGANSTIVCGNKIGAFAFIGAGTVLVKEVFPFELIIGNPGRKVGYVCVCGKKLDNNLSCICGSHYKFNKKNQLVINKLNIKLPWLDNKI